MANFSAVSSRELRNRKIHTPRLLYRTFLSVKMNTLHTASNRKRPSVNWNRGYIQTMTPEKLQRKHLQQRVHSMKQIGLVLSRLTWNSISGLPVGGTTLIPP